MTVVYDAAVLIAAERNDSSAWADHEARLELGILPIVTAPVVAQVERGGRQASLHRLLKGCVWIGFEPEEAAAVGRLLGAAGTSDVVDGHVVRAAAERNAVVVTSDVDDLTLLASHVDPQPRIVPLS